MPQTDQEFSRMRDVLLTYFGIEDAPDVWLTIYGQLLSSPIATRRFTYKKLATAGHRLRINKFINDKKGLEIEKLHAKLKETMEKVSGSAMPEGSHDFQGEVQGLHRTSDTMVHSLEGDGVY